MAREWTRKELSAVACSPFTSLLGNPGATHWRAFEEAAGCLPGEEQPAALVRRTGGQKGHIVQYIYIEPRRKPPSAGPAGASAAEGRKRRRVAPSAPPAEGGRRQSPRPTSPPARRGNGNPTRPYMAASSDKKITQLVAMGFTEAQVWGPSLASMLHEASSLHRSPNVCSQEFSARVGRWRRLRS